MTARFPRDPICRNCGRCIGDSPCTHVVCVEDQKPLHDTNRPRLTVIDGKPTLVDADTYGRLKIAAYLKEAKATEGSA